MSDNNDQGSNGNNAAMQKVSAADQPAGNRQVLQKILVDREVEIKRLAGAVLSPERLVSLALLAVGGNELLAKSTVSSVVGAVLAAARAGLELDGVQAALVPMWNSKRSCYEAQCWPMFRGLVSRAYDDPSVAEVTARAVYEGEYFECRYGTHDEIVHTPDPSCIDAANLIAVYAVIHIRGRAKFEVMFRSEVDAIMARSPSVRAKRFSPWESDYVAMALKTVLKRITKTAPIKSQRLYAAVSVDDENERADFIDAESEPAKKDEAPKAQRAKRTDSLKNDMKAQQEHGDPHSPSTSAGAGSSPTGVAPPATAAAQTSAVGGPGPTAPDEVTPAPARAGDEIIAKIRGVCERGGAKTTGAAIELVRAVLELRDLESLSSLTPKQAMIALDKLSGAEHVRRTEALKKQEADAAANGGDPSMGNDR